MTTWNPRIACSAGMSPLLPLGSYRRRAPTISNAIPSASSKAGRLTEGFSGGPWRIPFSMTARPNSHRSLRHGEGGLWVRRPHSAAAAPAQAKKVMMVPGRPLSSP